MLPTSKYLINFLETNILHLLNDLKKQRFSPTSEKLLGIFFKQIRQSYTHLQSRELNYRTFNKTNIPKGETYDLCPLYIQKYVENMDSLGRLYELKIGERRIRVFMIYEVDNTAHSRFFDNAIEKVYLWLYFAQHYAKKHCSQELDIFFYFTDLEKKIPLSKTEIGQANANTAFTFSCKPKNEIYIYRKEEWCKVFIHECFHNLGFDFSEIESSHIDKQILSIFPVKADVRLFETYCELWAELFNIMFIVFFMNKKESDENLAIKKMIKRTEQMLHYEKMFSLFQCAKILSFFGISYNELYERDYRSQQIRSLQYKETTPILSYYILKAILIFNANAFLEWCVLHNGYSINFNKEHDKVEANLNDYCQLIREHYLHPTFIGCLSELETWFARQKKTNRANKTELTTLRMSLYET